MVVESLQTLCTAALRIQYSTKITAADPNGVSLTVTMTPTPIDPRAVDVFFESLEVEDNPRLQVESAWVLTDIVDRLTPERRDDVEGYAILVLMNLHDSDDEAARIKATAVIRGLVTGDCVLRRDLVLRPMVEGLREDDNDHNLHNLFSYWFCLLLPPDDVCPDVAQRVLDSGVLPRLVELLQTRDDPSFRYNAVCFLGPVLNHADLDATRDLVVNEAVIPLLIRIVSTPHDDEWNEETRAQAAMSILEILERLPDCRDLALQSGAVPALLDLLQSTQADLIDAGVWALERLFLCAPTEGTSAALRPFLYTLVRLLSSPLERVTAVALQGLTCLTDLPDRPMQLVVDAGVCRQLVELLRHPSPEVQDPALNVVGNIVVGTDQQLQAIMEHQPLPSLLALLNSPDPMIRGKCCWIIGNLADESQERIEQIIDQGIVPPLLRCLSHDESELRQDAARAVGIRLTAHGSSEQVRVLVEDGCLPPLCDFLTNPESDDEVVSNALKGIANVLAASDQSRRRGTALPIRARIASAGRIVSDSGGVDKIRALVRHRDVDIRARAVRVLRTYFGRTSGRGGRRRRPGAGIPPRPPRGFRPRRRPPSRS